jgi:hypothetical protein
MWMLDMDAGVDDLGNFDATVAGVGCDDPAIGESARKTRLSALPWDARLVVGNAKQAGTLLGSTP